MKQGDKIYLAEGDKISTCHIVEFHAHCTQLKCNEKIIVSCTCMSASFYGYGYSNSGQLILFLDKLWHYFPATLIETLKYKYRKYGNKFNKIFTTRKKRRGTE